jgi:hypothetical protein
LEQTVSPASFVTLNSLLAINDAMPRCCVAFEVVRQDGLTMFSGSPMFNGAQPFDLRKNSTLDVQIRFQANLLKGIYTVNLRLLDEKRTWQTIEVRSVATFAVHETSRSAGVAELLPAYTFNRRELTAANAF